MDCPSFLACFFFFSLSLSLELALLLDHVLRCLSARNEYVAATASLLLLRPVLLGLGLNG